MQHTGKAVNVDPASPAIAREAATTPEAPLANEALRFALSSPTDSKNYVDSLLGEELVLLDVLLWSAAPTRESHIRP